MLAVTFYGMPFFMALAACLYGFAYGLWPILWIIIGAVFFYKASVRTGQFDIIRHSISTASEDQRIQLLLVAFGAFLEGAAGFGAPVAITTALLVGLGFPPVYAAGLCLIANAAPLALGATGIPMIVGVQVIGADPYVVDLCDRHGIGLRIPGQLLRTVHNTGSCPSHDKSGLHVLRKLLVAASTVGGAVRKMISPQSIAVASATVGLVTTALAFLGIGV